MFALISRTKSLAVTLSSISGFVADHTFAHIISLNPENVVEASENTDFWSSYNKAELVIADGAGIILAARILGIPAGERITGVDLMDKLIRQNPQKRILFVGARHNAATKTLEHFAHDLGVSGENWKAFPDVDKDNPQL
ncbi:WecB/TagA/CpsF family glycosyltransferase, partial [Candidatus Woesebacteria bacterium]|nr:WecB/TagA/CpsF family glycosyltransferase [Candidatus Woesebacteria bacterium]